MATELSHEEEEIFGLGKEVEFPACIGGDGFCFHRCVWFITGNVPGFPEWSTYDGHIRGYLEANRGVLRWDNPLFEATQATQVYPLECVAGLAEGTYLIQLIDRQCVTGHWAALVGAGIFDPGAGRKDIPVVDWIRIFRNRFGVRRLFPVVL